jgi:hypothetical protein
MADLILAKEPIQISPAAVSIADSRLPVDGVVGGLDLTAYQGERPRKIRIVRERDGSISVDPAKGYWLEREVDIPAKQTVLKPVLDAKTAKPVLDDDGQPKMEIAVIPITSVAVKTWER